MPRLVGQRRRNWSCIIEQLRTGTSHRLPKVAIPPLCGPGEPGGARPRLFATWDILLFQYPAVMTPIPGTWLIVFNWFLRVTARTGAGPAGGRARKRLPGRPPTGSAVG